MDHRISGRNSVNAIEQLEPRWLLSAALTTINWLGHSIQVIEDSYVVQLKTGTNFDQIASKKGFTDVQSLGGGFYSFNSTKLPSAIANWGRQTGRVLDVEPNMPMYADAIPTPTQPAVVPNDTYFQTGDQWDMYNYGQTITNLGGTGAVGVPLVGVPGDDIDATQAWSISTGSKNVVVAVLDTGVDITHPDLVNNIWTNPNESGAQASNGVDDDADGYIDDVHGWNTVDNNNDVTDNFGHGTHVSGTIGAEGNNGIGIAGINWNVTIIPVKVLGDQGEGSSASIIAGIQYITELKNLWVSSGGKAGANVTVANLSLGGINFPYNTIEARAYEAAGKAGILTVVAAGNGTENDGVPINLDISFGFPGKYSLNLPSVITVASTDNQGNLSLFSNYGAQTVQIAAPGESIMSTYPINLDTTDGNQDGYQLDSGTSMAAPHVTGVIALMESVEPGATAAQLKQALFSSVDVLPSLSPLSAKSGPKVTTAGQVNAYKALLAIQNEFLQTDTYTQGNWQGFGAGKTYGTLGAYVAGESTTFPAGVSITGGSTTILADSSKRVNKNTAALQTIADPTQRIEAGLTSGTAISVNLDLATPTRVTLYLADYDNQKRVENVQVVDPATGQSLSGQYFQTISDFKGGEYVTYQLSGNVQLLVSHVSGPNAIVNGVFLDPVVPPATLNVSSSPYANFVSNNTTASGDWQSFAGSQGAYLPGQTSNFPSFVTTTISNGQVTRAPGGRGNSALLENVAGNGRNGTYLSSATQIVLDMNFTDGQIHRTSFYAANSKNKGGAERIDIVDPTTGQVIATQDISSFSKGTYATFDLSGQVQVRITRLAGPEAALSGVFFDAPPGGEASYVGVDSTTRGNWMGAYGSAAHYIVGNSPTTFTNPAIFSLGPFYTPGATVTMTASSSAMPNIVSAKTKNKSALEVSSGPRASRILSRLITRDNMSVNLNFSDGRVHQVAVYVADTDTRNQRSEIVQIADPTTHQVLAQQQVSNFKNGKYVIFNVRGTVDLQIARVAGPSAVVNGIFVD